MSAIRKARALRRGATLGLVAPAGPIESAVLEESEVWLRELGFEPRRREDLTARRGFLAGDDTRRAAEFMAWIDDPAVDGILAVRGGYGCHRIMSRLDADRVRRAAKPLMGYSDVTTLLLWQLRQAGLAGIHGPMLERGAQLDVASRQALAAAFCGEPQPPLAGTCGSGGRAEGILLGGSLSLLTASLGTPWEVDTRGAILMFEDTTEQPYAIDRMLHHLLVAGKLDEVVGVGVGQLDDCVSQKYPETGVDDVIDDVLAGRDIPVVRGLPFGHTDLHLPWPVGVLAAIDGERAQIELLESAVS